MLKKICYSNKYGKTLVILKPVITFHGFGYTFWTFWIKALHPIYKLWISNILATSITEETCIVEMRIWCNKIGTVNFIKQHETIRRNDLNLLNIFRSRVKGQCLPKYIKILVAHILCIIIFLHEAICFARGEEVTLSVLVSNDEMIYLV